MTSVATETTEQLRDRVREAGARGAHLRVVGRGTWLGAGRPVRATAELSTRELSGIVSYVPGDLTLTARAGTTLAEIREATAPHNQWLALDPHGSDEGTLGATVATASAGPLSTAFGTPRDLVLGMEFVTGTGAIARGGGRVVKNVAGFDLARLLTGSWGSLGVISEVTVRLHARPAVDVSFAMEMTRGADDLERVRQLLRHEPFSPYACEILNERLANTLLGARSDMALFRLGGNAEAVAAQRTAIEALGAARDVDTEVWTRLRAVEPEGAIVLRLSKLGSEIARIWNEAQAIVRGNADAMIHARPARGMVRVIMPRDERAIAALRSGLSAPALAKRVGERVPTELWPLIGAPPTADSLSTRMKQAFDPRRVLNPGILGEPA